MFKIDIENDNFTLLAEKRKKNMFDNNRYKYFFKFYFTGPSVVQF
jgi:hypothetical protein